MTVTSLSLAPIGAYRLWPVHAGKFDRVQGIERLSDAAVIAKNYVSKFEISIK